MSERRKPEITDEGVERLRARIGIPEPHPQPPHYECPNEDAFRHASNAIGDDNPEVMARIREYLATARVEPRSQTQPDHIWWEKKG